MQRLQQIIESWSRGQGEPDAFILRIIVITCSYVGGSRSKSILGSGDIGIQFREIVCMD